jgi:hypothetical protein
VPFRNSITSHAIFNRIAGVSHPKFREVGGKAFLFYDCSLFAIFYFYVFTKGRDKPAVAAWLSETSSKYNWG